MAALDPAATNEVRGFNMTMMISRLFKTFTLLLLTLGLTLHAGAQQLGPAERIQQAVDTFLGILQDDSLSREERNARIREEAFELFDERAMAQSVLSTNWRQATPEQQEEFQDLLAQLLESTYIDRLDAYTDQTARVLGEQINGTRATVNSVVVSGTTNVPVSYRLRQLQDGWVVYDVEVENVSLVNSYRETYLSVVRRQGMDGLLQQMRDKIAELEQQNG